jgi:hypothetical protein
LHGFDLTVERNEQALPTRADFSRIPFEDAQIALLIEEAENTAAGKREHRRPTLHSGNVETQLSPIESISPSEGWHRETILVVSNEHARAAA